MHLQRRGPGPGQFFVTHNDGKQMHTFGIGRLRSGKTLDDFRAAVEAQGEPPDFDGTVADVSLPGHLISPGQTLEIAVATLRPGHYVAGDLFPSEGDGTPHVLNGLLAEFTIDGDEAPLPRGDATYSIKPGHAVTGPTTLRAGHHRFHITARPGAEHLELNLWTPESNQSVEDANRAVNALFTAPTPPPPGTGRQVAQKMRFSLFDFDDVRDLVIGVDLKPGRYVLAAIDTDLQPPLPQVTEQIDITVRPDGMA